MTAGRIDRLCRGLLPPNYERVSAQAPAIQDFLDRNLPPPLAGNVTVLTVDDRQLVIAAHSPAIANFLRLHVAEIGQQLRETLGLEQALQVRTVPASLLRVSTPGRVSQPRQVGEESIAAIERSAEWIEDEALGDALRSLARSLRKESPDV